MPRAARQFALLALLFLCASLHHAGYTWYLLNLLQHPNEVPAAPFELQLATRTIGNGPLRGDQILAIDGHPLNSYRQWLERIASSRGDDVVRLTLSEPSGRAMERDVRIPSQKEENFGTTANIAIAFCLNFLIPTVAIVLGFGATAIRPRDPNAWLMLLMLLGFGEVVRHTDWYGPYPRLTMTWRALWGGTWPIWMLLFGIHFPSRLGIDRRYPWLKYLVIAPVATATLFMSSIQIVWLNDINSALSWRPLLVRLYPVIRIAGMVAISGFFAALGSRPSREPSADSRRRLKILYAGALVSLTPVFLMELFSLFRGQDIFVGVPWPLTVVALLFLTFFPLTLAYVIVVERAMDLRFVIRQSIRYGLAKVGFRAARVALFVLAFYIFNSAASKGHGKPSASVELAAVGVGLLILRKRTADRASQWVDKKFFRESYDAEKVLSELATEVGRYVEIDPLFEKVARRGTRPCTCPTSSFWFARARLARAMYLSRSTRLVRVSR